MVGKMKVRIWIILAASLLLTATLVHASDYTPLPGVAAPEEIDFGGKTVTFLWAVPEDPATWDDQLRERIEEAERLFNVKIQGLRPPNREFVWDRIYAGDSVRDVIIRGAREISYHNMVAQGLLYPVGELLPEEYYQSLSKVDYAVNRKLKVGDQYYSFGGIHGPFNATMFFMQYNKELIEREGLEDPYNLYLRGEWTYDAFREYAIALTKDTDGDGVIDQFGVDYFGGFHLIRWLVSNGVELTREEDGRRVFNYTSPEAIRALNFIAALFNEDKVATRDSNLFYEGKVGFNAMDALAGMRHARGRFEWGMLPLPKGPDVDRYMYPAYNFEAAFLPANVEDPRGLIALTMFLFRPDDSKEDRLDYLIDLAIDREEQLEVFLTAMEVWEGEGDPFQGSVIWDVVTPALTAVSTGAKSPAAAMEEIAPAVQAAIDDIFKQ